MHKLTKNALKYSKKLIHSFVPARNNRILNFRDVDVPKPPLTIKNPGNPSVRPLRSNRKQYLSDPSRPSRRIKTAERTIGCPLKFDSRTRTNRDERIREPVKKNCHRIHKTITSLRNKLMKPDDQLKPLSRFSSSIRPPR